jgi:hypothetical protein
MSTAQRACLKNSFAFAQRSYIRDKRQYTFCRDENAHSIHFLGILWDLTMPNWDCVSLQRCVVEGVFDRLNQDQREQLLDGAEGRRTMHETAVNGDKEKYMPD